MNDNLPARAQQPAPLRSTDRVDVGVVMPGGVLPVDAQYIVNATDFDLQVVSTIGKTIVVSQAPILFPAQPARHVPKYPHKVKTRAQHKTKKKP